jgi:hypothetical protein
MQVVIVKLVVVVVALGIAFGGIGAALGRWGDLDAGPPVQLAGEVDARKHDADDEVGASIDDDDGDEGTSGGGTSAGTSVGATSVGATSVSGA